jgi:hypothetical protein
MHSASQLLGIPEGYGWDTKFFVEPRADLECAVSKFTFGMCV